MNERDPLLTILFDGEAVGPGRIPVSHLIRFLFNMDKALKQAGHVLLNDIDRVREGRHTQNINRAVELDLVSLTRRGSKVVLGLDLGQAEQTDSFYSEKDFGLEVLEKAIDGLQIIQYSELEPLPLGYNPDVLVAWHEAGRLFTKNIVRIELTMNQRTGPLKAVYTPEGFNCIQQRLRKTRALMSRGAPISQNIRKSLTLDELAREQNVQPIANVSDLFGTWPGEDDDGFEADIDELRKKKSN